MQALPAWVWDLHPQHMDSGWPGAFPKEKVYPVIGDEEQTKSPLLWEGATSSTSKAVDMGETGARKPDFGKSLGNC